MRKQNEMTSINIQTSKNVIHLELKNHKKDQKCSIIELKYSNDTCNKSFVDCKIDGHNIRSANKMSWHTFEALGQRGELVNHSTCKMIKSLGIPMYEFVAKENAVTHDIGILYIPSGSTPNVGVELDLYKKEHMPRYPDVLCATMLPNKRVQISWDVSDVLVCFKIFSKGLKINNTNDLGQLSRCVQLTADPTEKTTQYLGTFTEKGDGFDIINPCLKGSVIFSINNSEGTMIHIGCQDQKIVHRYHAVLPGV